MFGANGSIQENCKVFKPITGWLLQMVFGFSMVKRNSLFFGIKRRVHFLLPILPIGRRDAVEWSLTKTIESFTLGPRFDPQFLSSLPPMVIGPACLLVFMMSTPVAHRMHSTQLTTAYLNLADMDTSLIRTGCGYMIFPRGNGFS